MLRIMESLSESKKSLQLVRLIDAIGFSREKRDIVRLTAWHTDLLYQTFYKNSKQRTELVGSAADGLHESNLPLKYIKKLDQDFVHLMHDTTVLDHRDPRLSSCSPMDLIAVPEDNFPGYYALYFLFTNEPIPLPNTLNPFQYKNDKYSEIEVLSSKTNGPARTDMMNYDGSIGPEYIENVWCYFYNSWPAEANQWISRTKERGWPSLLTVKDIVSQGCTLAPVGHHDCDYKDFQWRIGFRGEKILYSELNEIQIKCHILLRFIQKDQLIDACGDLISSFILKNTIFWCAEQLSCNWTPKNFLGCFRLCIRKLISFVEAKYCPHYFIESRNLFHSKMTDKSAQRILNILHSYEQDRMLVFKLECFKNVTSATHLDEPLLKRCSDISVLNHCFKFLLEPYSYFYGESFELWQRYKAHDIIKSFKNCKEILQTLLSHKATFIQHHIHYARSMLGMLYYSQYKSTGCMISYKMAEKCLALSLKSPICTISLRAASHAFMEKKYGLCLDICYKVLDYPPTKKTLGDRILHVQMLLELIALSIDEIKSNEIICQIKHMVVDLFYGRANPNHMPAIIRNHYIVSSFRNFLYLAFRPMKFSVYYMTAEKWAVPDVIRYELLSVKNTEKFSGILIDPFVHCRLLQFLICLMKKDFKEMNRTVLKLEKVVRTEINENIKTELDKEHAVLSYNVIVYCCVKAKCFDLAVKYLMMSFKLSPSKHNTAYGYIKCILQNLFQGHCCFDGS